MIIRRRASAAMKVVLCVCATLAAGAVSADQPTSYMPVDIKEDFATTMQRMQVAKPAIEQRQQQLLVERYDLSNHPASGVSMSRGKPIQAGVRVKLPNLGYVSKGELFTIENYYEAFNGVLNPKQLEGLRLLVTPFAQQLFNRTEDRRSEQPSRGVTCFDCHANGHTNGSTHLVGDIRPQEFRHRIDTPSLRGVNIERLFGSQRALKTVEDFTEFE